MTRERPVRFREGGEVRFLSATRLFNTLPAAEFAARNIPNATLAVFDTGGHLLVGHDRQVRAVVGDFLTKAGTNPEQTPRIPDAFTELRK